jgi:signal transduction histidine kinase
VSVLRRRGGASHRGDPSADQRPEAQTPGGLTRRLLAASSLLALIVGGAFGVLLLAIDDLRGAERRTDHSQNVLIAANELERLLLDLETGERGFVLTRQGRFLEPWNAARAELPRRSAALRRLVAGDPAAERRAARIAQAVRGYVTDYSVPLVDAARRGDPSARSVSTAAAGKRRVDAVRVEFDRLLDAQRRISADSTATADSAARRASAAALAGLAGSIALIAIYVGYLRRAIVRPIRRAATMAGRLAGGDLSARMPQTGPGEVGALERTFNVMAGSLERSRDELAELAAEQAALRRVATIVARGASPPEAFSAVAEELGQLLGASITKLLRYEPDGTATVVGGWSEPGIHIPIGTRLTVAGDGVVVSVLGTGRSARTELFDGPPGSVAACFRDLGARSGVGSPIEVEGRLWGVAIAASARPEPLPAHSEDRIVGFTELAATAIANAEARAELTGSRARIVATADETRRQIERDLHDGAQQRLVSLALQLRGAQATVPPELGELNAELADIAAEITGVLDELREMARGIHPAILAEGGLHPALKTLARRSVVPVELDVRTEGRLPEPIEVGAYFVVSEALTNAAKHANASYVAVDVEPVDGVLRMSIRDDGVGGADPARGSGLVGLKDRVEALGGSIAIESAAGEGTELHVELPLSDELGILRLS